MPAVIDLAARRARAIARDAALVRARALLEAFHSELFDAAFQVAIADAWNEWDEATPEMTDLELEPEALLECADAEVRALAALWTEVDRVMSRPSVPRATPRLQKRWPRSRSDDKS